MGLLLQVMFFTIIAMLVFNFQGVRGSTIIFINKCDFTVWPGILGNPTLATTGFELSKSSSRSIQAPPGWSGRFWGRTGCTFDESGQGSCSTADCGSGHVECNGSGAAPPATLVEFTLGSGKQDFYDVSLVDGYNLPMMVEPGGGSGPCGLTGCLADLNRRCPTELQVAGGGACRSACEAFGTQEYCCSGAHSSPETCAPSMYSQLFKNACPRSYSYAYDDATSTFTCMGADYTVTFCPSGPSQKSTNDLPGSTPITDESGLETRSGDAATLRNEPWLAAMATATGDSIRKHPYHDLVHFLFPLSTMYLLFLHF